MSQSHPSASSPTSTSTCCYDNCPYELVFDKIHAAFAYFNDNVTQLLYNTDSIDRMDSMDNMDDSESTNIVDIKHKDDNEDHENEGNTVRHPQQQRDQHGTVHDNRQRAHEHKRWSTYDMNSVPVRMLLSDVLRGVQFQPTHHGHHQQQQQQRQKQHQPVFIILPFPLAPWGNGLAHARPGRAQITCAKNGVKASSVDDSVQSNQSCVVQHSARLKCSRVDMDEEGGAFRYVSYLRSNGKQRSAGRHCL